MMELTIFIENTVRNFTRYHKYTLGSELRVMFHEGLVLIGEANTGVNWGQSKCAAGQGRVIKRVGSPPRKVGQPPGSKSLEAVW
jgi:hypothetical protein